MAAIVITALTGALYLQIRANGRIAADREQVLAINKENLALLEAQAVNAKRANQIAAQEAADAGLWHRRFNAVRIEISHAKPEDDGPLAPVLRNALDRMPEPDSSKTRAAASP